MIADSRIAELMSAEVDMFIRNHPRSKDETTRSQASLLAGVPMPWMKRWAGPFPVVAERAEGGTIVDIDGKRHELIAADPIGQRAIAVLIAFVREHGAFRGPG